MAAIPALMSKKFEQLFTVDYGCFVEPGLLKSSPFVMVIYYWSIICL